MEGIDLMKYVEKSQQEYLDYRARLEHLADELARLRKQRLATENTAQRAGKQWREMFKESLGKAGDEVRRLQAEEHAMTGELEQLDELIAELEPQVEAQRVRTAGCRAAYLDKLKQARQQHDCEHLEASAEELLSSESARPFLAALSGRLASSEREFLDESGGLLVSMGYDAPMEAGWYASIAQFPNDDQPRLRKELAIRENQMIAEIVRRHLPEAEAAERPAILEPIERLGCEAPEGSFKSGLSVRKRLQEIEEGKLDDSPDPRGSAWGESMATMRSLHLANARA